MMMIKIMIIMTKQIFVQRLAEPITIKITSSKSSKMRYLKAVKLQHTELEQLAH